MNGVAVLFSGQGAQVPGMMKDLFDCYKSSHKIFQIADKKLGRSISELTFNGTQEELNLTHNTQPCVLAADLAAYEALRENGIRADAAAGFSLGEYGALVAAECISLADVFPIIQKRADYMQEAVPVGQGAMAAVSGKTLDEVQALCDQVEGYVVPTNVNCPGQIVVSGKAEDVQTVVDNAREAKIKAMVLPVSAPFHCELLKSAADKLAVELEKIVIKKPTLKVYLNFDGEQETSGEMIMEKLLLQVKSPVYWEKTLRNMYSDGIRIFIECGPGKTLSGFVKKTFKGKEDVVSLRVSDMNTLQMTLDYFRENM